MHSWLAVRAVLYLMPSFLFVLLFRLVSWTGPWCLMVLIIVIHIEYFRLLWKPDCIPLLWAVHDIPYSSFVVFSWYVSIVTTSLGEELFCWLNGFVCIYKWKSLYSFEPPYDKTNKMTCAPSEDSDQPGHPPSLIRVFADRMRKTFVLSYPLSAAKTLMRLGGCPGWFESLLGAHHILLVLSRGGSFMIVTQPGNRSLVVCR